MNGEFWYDFMVLFSLFIALDVAAFWVTDFPKYPTHFVYKLPGGGFLGLLKYGWRKKP